MMELDQTDLHILHLLRKHSRMQWRDIGEKVFLSGQAVGNRIKRLEDAGIIEAYTIQVNEEKAGRPILAIVTVFMKTTNHSAFLEFLRTREAVLEAFRVSGEGCYSLKVQAANQAELNDLLDGILAYGNYRVNMSIGKIK